MIKRIKLEKVRFISSHKKIYKKFIKKYSQKILFPRNAIFLKWILNIKKLKFSTQDSKFLHLFKGEISFFLLKNENIGSTVVQFIVTIKINKNTHILSV